MIIFGKSLFDDGGFDVQRDVENFEERLHRGLISSNLDRRRACELIVV